MAAVRQRRRGRQEEGRTAGAYGDGGLCPSPGQVLRGKVRLRILRDLYLTGGRGM
nr:MAG TPA: hypothetical protein [Caudoviricetes sp.]